MLRLQVNVWLYMHRHCSVDNSYCVKLILVDNTLFHIIHTIHRFKSSDRLKKDHMSWNIFYNVYVWKLIHVCYFFTISLTLGETVTAAKFEDLVAYFPDFMVR